MFLTKYLEKLKTHILCSITFFWKSFRLWDNVAKCGWAWKAIEYVLWSMRLGIFCYGDLLRYRKLWTAPAVWSLLEFYVLNRIFWRDNVFVFDWIRGVWLWKGDVTERGRDGSDADVTTSYIDGARSRDCNMKHAKKIKEISFERVSCFIILFLLSIIRV
jgi:hypothetical protein